MSISQYYASKVNPSKFYLLFHGYSNKNLHVPRNNIAQIFG